jgi:hypothetical protein
MADLSHWDFTEQFRGKEVAVLIFGEEPSNHDDFPFVLSASNSVAAKITPVLRRMERALNEAGHQLSDVANSGPDAAAKIESFQILPHALYSETMLRSIASKSEFGFGIFKDWEPKFSGRFDDAYFTRGEIDRWLKSIGMKSVYPFIKEREETSKVLNLSDPVSTEFKLWLSMDTWQFESAMWLLAGVIPREIYEGFGFHKTDGKLLHNDDGQRDEKVSEIEDLIRLWKSNPTNPDIAPPMVFINWAQAKGRHISWWDEVQQSGLLGQDADSKACQAEPAKSQPERPLQARERAALLRVIGGLVELLLDKRSTRAKTDAASDIISALVSAYGDKDGISKRNLEGKFAEAKQVLDAD